MFHFELLMIRSLEKNNDGEKLTKQKTKNSGDQWRTQDLAKGQWRRAIGARGRPGSPKFFEMCYFL